MFKKKLTALLAVAAMSFAIPLQACMVFPPLLFVFALVYAVLLLLTQTLLPLPAALDVVVAFMGTYACSLVLFLFVLRPALGVIREE